MKHILIEEQAKKRTHLYVIVIALVLLSVLGMAIFQNIPDSDIQTAKIDITDNRAGELVFAITLDEYIERFNAVYKADYRRDYLTPSTQWRKELMERGVHAPHEAVCYDFSEDYTVWTMPGISVYTASDTGMIQEITVNFDDHSYQQDMYALYEELCYYTLKVFFPDIDENTLIWLYQMLNNYAYQNTLANEQGFDADCLPQILYYRNGIGVYPYFAIGESMHFCILPVTEKMLDTFHEKGTMLYELSDVGSFSNSSGENKEDETLLEDNLSRIDTVRIDVARLLYETKHTAKTEASPYMPQESVLTQDSIDAMETILIQNGYPILDTDNCYPAFIANGEGFDTFQKAAETDSTARQEYLWISPSGGLHYCALETSPDGDSFTEAAMEWKQEKQSRELEITELYKRELLDWTLTENGHFYYKLYEAHSPAFEDYTLLRLYAPDKQLCDQSAAYVEPVGYQSNNLFSSEWSSPDYAAICFNDTLEFLYREQTGKILDPLLLDVQEHPFYYQIPADTFESVITAYFDIAPENLRALCCYDADTDMYPWLDVAYDNLSYFPLITPDVKAYHENSDGTITLTVDAMCVGLKTDSLFRHELTIQPDIDGGFRYVSNRILETYGHLPEYIPRLEMQR